MPAFALRTLCVTAAACALPPPVPAAGNTRLLIRANAQFQIKAVTDPKPYQNFFAAPERPLFLKAQEVN